MSFDTFRKEFRVASYCLLAAAIGAVAGSHLLADRSLQVTPVSAAAPALVSAGAPETSYAPVVDRALPAVVNISSSKKAKVSMRGQNGRMPNMPQMDPFFRQFFGRDFQFPDGGDVPRQRSQRSLGSGVIIRPDGYLLTNNHVIEGADDITVTLNDKRELKAKVIGTDPKTDIAVLKVEGTNLPTVPFADSTKAKVGDVVLAMGNPFGLGQTVTMGIISAQGRTNLGIEDYEDFIQTDAAINPGNSGGALINARGELVGINTAILGNGGGNQGIGFAVPINLARSVMTQVMDHGKVVRGYLGLVPQNITPGMQKAMKLKSTDGVLVGDVTSDAPAGKAGVQRGDVILEVDGQKIESSNQLRMKISMMSPGATANLKVLRDGEEKTIAVKLGEMPTTAENRGSRFFGRERGGENSNDGALDGVEVDNLDAQTAREAHVPASVHGVIVTDVDEGSAAAQAGLKEGDVIQEVNRKTVTNVAEFDRALQGMGKNAGTGTVLLLVNRGGNTLYIAIPAK
jgi:serine protease Do